MNLTPARCWSPSQPLWLTNLRRLLEYRRSLLLDNGPLRRRLSRPDTGGSSGPLQHSKRRPRGCRSILDKPGAAHAFRGAKRPRLPSCELSMQGRATHSRIRLGPQLRPHELLELICGVRAQLLMLQPRLAYPYCSVHRPRS